MSQSVKGLPGVALAAETLLRYVQGLQNAHADIVTLWESLRGPDVPIQQKPPETPTIAPIRRAYVSPPPPPVPVPDARLDALASKFGHQVKYTKPVDPPKPAPAAAPVTQAPPDNGQPCPRWAHYPPHQLAAMPNTVQALIQAGDAPWRAWRLHRGMTMQQVADKAVWSTGYQSDLENKRWREGKFPSPERLARLAAALSVPIIDLTPTVVRTTPPKSAAELDQEDREIQRAERALAERTHRARTPRTLSRQEQPPRYTKVDVVGMLPREVSELERRIKPLPLRVRFHTYDAYSRALPYSHLIFSTRGVPASALDIPALKSKGVTVRHSDGGITTIFDMLRAIAASEHKDAA